jgi:hypothetical protein
VLANVSLASGPSATTSLKRWLLVVLVVLVLVVLVLDVCLWRTAFQSLYAPCSRVCCLVASVLC